MSSPVALNVKLSKTTQTCCGKEGVKQKIVFHLNIKFHVPYATVKRDE